MIKLVIHVYSYFFGYQVCNAEANMLAREKNERIKFIQL